MARSATPRLALLYLLSALVGLGAAYHHLRRAVYPADDIGFLATLDPQPARLLGIIAEEPIHSPASEDDPLQSFARAETTATVLRATHLRRGEDWLPVSGRARLSIAGRLTDLHIGDTVEAVGVLAAPAGAANPGELDYAEFLQDRRIRAQLWVRKTSEGVTLRERGGMATPAGWLALARSRGQDALMQALPGDLAGVAAALLLGDGAAMTRDEWDRYIRTGVVHVLVISGQHLAVLAAFVWGVLRLAGVRRRRGAILVALLVLAYALLTGGRPPVLRSAVMVCVFCGGLVLRRPAPLANTFALAWIVVMALHPADVFDTGCQLSFLTVAVLCWGIGPWLAAEPDPLERLIDESRPWWQRGGRWLGRQIVLAYVITAACWLAVAPLVAARYHLLSLAALLIGPPVVWLTSLALLAGFLLLVAAFLCWPLVPILAWIVQASLAGCEWLVRRCDQGSLVHYVGEIPEGWLWIFYLGLFFILSWPMPRRHWDAAILAALGWLCVGLVIAGYRGEAGELRCTFLAVGHGNCTVLETPEGRVLLYDAGSLAGPDVARRQIAPFLWHRGIRRIDEIFLSHADLDHFNGVTSLLERFPIAQVTCTPTFAERPTPAVMFTRDVLERRRIPVRIVRAGDRLVSGSVDFEVLHPPEQGPNGTENERSLVLRVQHEGHALLLTGDLEKAGLERVLRLPARPVEVLMAPHHGSRTANTPGLAEWSRPAVVIASRGPPRGTAQIGEPYSDRGAMFLGTWPQGAVTVHSTAGRLWLETFRDRRRVLVK